MDIKSLRLKFLLVIFSHTTLVQCQTSEPTTSAPQHPSSELAILPKDASPATDAGLHKLYHPNKTGTTVKQSPATFQNVTSDGGVDENGEFSEGGVISPSILKVDTQQGENSKSSNQTTTSTLEASGKANFTVTSYSGTSLKEHHSKGRKGADDPPVNNQPTSSLTCINNKENNCSLNGSEISPENSTIAVLNPDLDKNTASTIDAKVEKISQSPSIAGPTRNVPLIIVNNTVSNESNSTSNSSRKPTYTLDEVTKQLIVPSSPESKYIIPVVATILVVPLLVALLMFLYKRGAEFWERRHYRRMDFLIDGMYND